MITQTLGISDRRDTNPLYSWRQENQLPRILVSATIGVSVATLSLWEAGSTYPTSRNLQSLANLMNEPTLPELWKAWHDSQPTSKGEDRNV